MAEPEWRTALRGKSVTLVPGVGPERAAHLALLGVHNVLELLLYFPFRYDRVSEQWSREGATVVDARFFIDSESTVRMRGSKSTLGVWLKSGDERVKALIFNQSYLRRQLRLGVQVRVKGKYDVSTHTILVSRLEILRGQQQTAEIIPVYRANPYWGALTLRKVIQAGVETFGVTLGEDLPAGLREEYRLVTLQQAVRTMHAPEDFTSLKQARRRLVFEEFLRFQLEIQGFRKQREKITSTPIALPQLQNHAEAFFQSLPFSPTSGQREALAEILADLAAPTPMHRLLHGEVGAGKTLVVFAAVYALAKCGYQSILMVPTSVLAWQHVESAKQWLDKLGVRIGFVSNLLSRQERERLYAEIEAGTVDLVIGTQVVTRSDLTFSRLRLLVIDEQHRFGVQVRKQLRQNTEGADVLQMSATPIPRTYALTLYGDVAVSTLSEVPPGRIPVETLLVDPADEQKVLHWLRRQLAHGRQAFVIAPRIEPPDTETEADFSAKTLAVRLEEELAGFRVGVVHGNQGEAERMAIMAAFASGEVQVLVATTIVEVGVNVPNATTILIYGADRFGLATLHQLRGRVARSTMAARCIAVAHPETEYGKARLNAFLESNDGFYLAEQDLRLRGPGEAFGERQSGLPLFQVGDVIRDLRAMQVARTVVQGWLDSEDFWLLPEYGTLRRLVLEGTDDWHADA